MADSRASTPALIWSQIRYENRLFWRTPVAAFFTIVFPLMFLFLFSMLFGGQEIDLGPRGTFTVAQFFAPTLGAFAAASATYTNLGIAGAIARDEGILKRFLGTPLPRSLYIVGKIGSAIWIAAIAITLMMTVGHFVFGVPVYAARLPAASITFIIGTLAFSALGLLVAAVAPSGDSAPAITNATILPMAFVSEVFIVSADAPAWLQRVGDFLPLKHFARAFQDAFNPAVSGAAFNWGRWGVLLAWGAVGAALALKFFSWDPKEGRKGAKGRRDTSPTRAASD